MGRLFWKFFAFVWLAQLAGIITVGLLFWLTDHRGEAPLHEFAADPFVDTEVRAAAEVLRFGGADAFRDWAAHAHGPTVFAVDAAGHDLLGRSLPARVDGDLRQLRSEPPEISELNAVATPDGRRYRLFAADHGFDRPSGGPPPPPGPRHWWPNLPPPTAMLATLAASVVTALLLAGYVAKPIRSLRNAFDAAAAGDLDLRIAPQLGARHDELSDLGRDFDRMAERLKAAMQGQRRLLHDVSHELRSPLARLQAAAGLIRQNPGKPDAMIARIEEEIARIDRLVGELLTLSRLEAGESISVDEEVDMRDLVHDIVHDANFEAQSQQREVVWDDRGSTTLLGRPELLHSAIENIVRNALKHAPESRTVRIETSVDALSRQYTLRVLDEGRGIPDQELPKLFTPFFRGTGSTRSDGYGLGLAIARRSIEAHGGTICAHNRPGGGLSVEIILPWRERAFDSDLPRHS
jgi:two-component system OmpR family sensor kinase